MKLHQSLLKLKLILLMLMTYKLEKSIHLSHLNNHVRCNELLIKKHLLNKLIQECGTLLITAVL